MINTEPYSDRAFYGLDYPCYKVEIWADERGFVAVYKPEASDGTCIRTFRVNSLTEIRPTPAEMEKGE